MRPDYDSQIVRLNVYGQKKPDAEEHARRVLWADELWRACRGEFLNLTIFRSAIDALVKTHKGNGWPSIGEVMACMSKSRAESNAPAPPVCKRCNGQHMIWAKVSYKSGDEYREDDGVTPCPACNQRCKLSPSKIEMTARLEHDDVVRKRNVEMAQAMTPDAARATLRVAERIGYKESKWDPEVLEILVAKATTLPPDAPGGSAPGQFDGMLKRAVEASPFVPVTCPPLTEAEEPAPDYPF